MNECQRAAALADVHSPLLVIAGAGSGKTMTMVRRVEHILKTTNCKPSEVLAITFTRNSTNEMKQRLSKLCGVKNTSGVVVSTIHALCLRILRNHLENFPQFGFTPHFSFANKKEQWLIVEEGLDEYDKSMQKETMQDEKARQYRTKKTLALIMKNRATSASCAHNQELQYVLGHYMKEMKETNTLDFSEFIHLTTKLLDSDGGDNIRKEYRYILVDEFQDVSLSQLNLIKALVGEKHGNITVVGDDDQSIYGFQGANIGNFKQFQDHFADRGVQTIRLEQNYRSSGNIVTASNAVISMNTMRHKKKLWTDRDGGNQVVVCECRNSQCEVAFITSEIKKRYAITKSWKSFAILFRTNATGLDFQQSLKDACIPYVVQGENLYSPMEIDDVLALLRISVNDDNRALLSIAKLIRAPIPHEVFLIMRDYASTNAVSLLHAARWTLTQPASKFAVKAAVMDKKDKAEKGKRKSPTASLKKVVDLIDTLRIRMEELSLPSFIRRVIDFHPWVKQRMQKEANKPKSQESGSGSGSSSGAVSGPGSGSSSDKCYGDLGAALIHEAEVFHKSSNHNASRSEIQAGEDPAIAERVHKVRCFLDHLDLCTENEEPLRLMADKNKAEDRNAAVKKGQVPKEVEGDEGRDAVFLGTVHQSKGLEWDSVFVVRFNENEFPLQYGMSGATTDEEEASKVEKYNEKVFEEEERRLAYVALSRGRHNLTISYIIQDQINGNSLVPPSRFLSDIPTQIRTHFECLAPTDTPSIPFSPYSNPSSSSSSSSSCVTVPSSNVSISSSSSSMESKVPTGAWATFVQNPGKTNATPNRTINQSRLQYQPQPHHQPQSQPHKQPQSQSQHRPHQALQQQTQLQREQLLQLKQAKQQQWQQRREMSQKASIMTPASTHGAAPTIESSKPQPSIAISSRKETHSTGAVAHQPSNQSAINHSKRPFDQNEWITSQQAEYSRPNQLPKFNDISMPASSVDPSLNAEGLQFSDD